MTLQISKLQVIPLYRWRRDAHYTSRTRWVMQRSVQFIATLVATGEQPLDENVSTLISSVRVRQPLSDYMNVWHAPSLISQPTTIYSRADLVEGSDYEYLPSSVYDWKVIDSYNRFNDQDQITHTIYVVQGQWDKYQGIDHSVIRREK